MEAILVLKHFNLTLLQYYAKDYYVDTRDI